MGDFGRQKARVLSQPQPSFFSSFLHFFSPCSLFFWFSFCFFVFVGIVKRVIGFLFAPKRSLKNKKKIAVIGGGIAGCSTAWSLSRSGFDVVLYESRNSLGGNAKTHNWSATEKQEEEEEKKEVITGLSVLAWPSKYFHNYAALLKEIGIDDCQVRLPFALRDPDFTDFFHGEEPEEYLKPDLDRWKRLVNSVRYVNVFLTGESSSLYAYSALNPFNILPLKFTACTLFRISVPFWESVIVPIYSSSFLTKNIESLPCSILPAVDDMIPLNGVPSMRTWTANSRHVFERLCRSVTVKTGHAVLEVRPIKQSDGSYTQMVRDVTNDFDFFDNVVFACSADFAIRAIREPSLLQSRILSNISYVDDHDHTFSKGIIHRDSSVIPEDLREDLIKGYSNYVRIYREPSKKRGHLGKVFSYENTFILSWVPAIQGEKEPMLITYDSQHEHIDNVQGEVSNMRAHPDLSLSNLLLAQSIGLIQGDFGLYYCGSFTTPGNGHDLSLLSGLIVANALGAPYPFSSNQAAVNDFRQLRGLMHL